MPKRPPLKRNEHVAETFKDKANMLNQNFLPPPPEAGLGDMQRFISLQTLVYPLIIADEEMKATVSDISGLIKLSKRSSHSSNLPAKNEYGSPTTTFIRIRGRFNTGKKRQVVGTRSATVGHRKAVRKRACCTLTRAS